MTLLCLRKLLPDFGIWNIQSDHRMYIIFVQLLIHYSFHSFL